MKTQLQYLKYKILEKFSTGQKAIRYHHKKKALKQELEYKKLGPLGASLKKLEYYNAYQVAYLRFKQRYNIEIPADACGNGNHFELVKMKLSDIYFRHPTRGTLPICQCETYLYLKNKDVSVYQNYLAIDLKTCDQNSLLHSVKGFNKLIQKMEKVGYDQTKSVIVVNEDHILIDGLHRSSILLVLKGESYEIPVVKCSDR